MRRTFAHFLAAVAMASLVSTGVQAGVVYDFTAESSFTGGITGSFTYTAPGFVASNVTISVASLDSCVVATPAGDSCGDQQFFPDSSPLEGGIGDLHDTIGFVGVTQTVFYYFADGSFGTPGVYDTVLFGTEQAGHLVIRAVGEISEPATLALLGFAVAGLGFARRRKLN